MKFGLAIGILLCALSLPASAQQSAATSQKRAASRAAAAKRTRPRGAPRAPGSSAKRAPAASAQVAAAATLAAPAPALPPLSFAPKPPPPPVVTYRDGLLGVTAEDAPLQIILDSIHAATGAIIEAPSMDQRVTVQLAPQSPAEAIAALLQGTQLDYAILGGSSDRDRVLRIIVTPKLAAGAQPPVPPTTPAPTMEDMMTRMRARER